MPIAYTEAEGANCLQRRLITLTVIVVLISGGVAAWFARLPVLVITDGPIVDVNDVISFNGGDSVSLSGAQWRMATIAARPATVGHVVFAALRPDWDLIPQNRVVPPGQDIEGFMAANRLQMEESQTVAAYVAYHWAGYPAEISGTGAEVLGVWPGSVADESGIEAGDVIVEVDGKPIRLADDLRIALRQASPQRILRLSVLRDGVVRTLALDPSSTAGGEYASQQPDLGMILVTRDLQATFEPPIRFHPADVGGPSGGLAFALYIADRLRGFDLPDNVMIVATGTVHVDSSVGPVGGVRYKLRAAVKENADLFLAPMATLSPAGEDQLETGKIGVIAVDSFDAAIRSLTRYFGHRYNGSVPGGG